MPTAYVPLAELEIRNQTTGRLARAQRIFPDGSFDAFLGLVPGRNELELVGTGGDGRLSRARRTVTFERVGSETETEAERRKAARMLVKLRHRTAETAAAPEPERRRLREVEVVPEASVQPEDESR